MTPGEGFVSFPRVAKGSFDKLLPPFEKFVACGVPIGSGMPGRILKGKLDSAKLFCRWGIYVQESKRRPPACKWRLPEVGTERLEVSFVGVRESRLGAVDFPTPRYPVPEGIIDEWCLGRL